MQSLYRGVRLSVLTVAIMAGLGACSAIPNAGPSRSQINDAGAQNNAAGIQIVDVTDGVARKLFSERGNSDFAAVLGRSTAFQQQLGIGDTVEVSIWEAPPATLFGGGAMEASQ